MCLSLCFSRFLSLCSPPPNTHSLPSHLTESILDRWQILYVIQFPCLQWMEGNDHFSKVSLGYKVWSLLCIIYLCEPVNSSIEPILPVQFLSFILGKTFHVHKEQQNEIQPFLGNCIRLTLLERMTERKKMPTVRGDHKMLAERNQDRCL